MPAPIALFVYNRPRHTRLTVEALAGNELASDSDLFIFSDAARNEQAAAAVAETRAYVATIRGFRSVQVIRRESNFGLAASITDGVGMLCREFGRAIVMEDDLQSSPHFLRFMNAGLDLYCDDDSVMHVSGSAYPVREFGLNSTYFLRVPLCWGWATWSRAWQHFRKDVDVMQRFDAAMIREFNFDGTHDYWGQLEANRDGRMNTWFVFWYASVFLRQGLALFPRKPMVRNIGMDGTGVHCSATSDFDVQVSEEPIQPVRMPLEVSAPAYRSHRNYFRSLQPSLRERGLRKARNALRRIWAGRSGRPAGAERGRDGRR
ncbi:MAG: hypothetical protein ABI771_02215 [Betaproteobacteria bacterium]